MSKYAILADSEPVICQKLVSLGYKLIYTVSVDEFISYEKKHVDMQCLKIDDNYFVLNTCNKLYDTLHNLGLNVIKTTDNVSGKYPQNIKLNALVMNKTIVGKVDSLDSKLIKYFKDNNFKMINVNQGYTACSCVKVSDNAIITSDKSIIRALKNTDINTLEISDGKISLLGAKRGETGFIGGASTMLDKNNLLFFGNIKEHPDYNKIKDFCYSRGVLINYIEEIALSDIGGAVLLNF